MQKTQSEEFADLARAVAEARDRDAFAKLFDHFAPRLKAYLQKLNLSEGPAEEITQEVMLVLWHKADMFDPGKSSLSTWLYRIARNRRIDHARRDRSGAIDSEDPMLLPEPEPMPDAAIDAEQQAALVKAALSELPQEQYAVIRLAFFLGYSHSRIAEETGLPVGTVKSRIRLAFARLRGLLDEASIESQ